jgi:hypothetical protein
MHSFNELIQQCTQFSLSALGEAQQRAEEALQTSSATPLLKTLQMLELQKAISAVGMFSMFDAILQDDLQSADGFRAAGQLLEKWGEVALKERFSDLQLAINVLKHGRGRSYDALVQKASVLPFRVKLPDEPFFSEGNVTDVLTLVAVDDTFLISCAEVIREVSLVVCAGASHGT